MANDFVVTLGARAGSYIDGVIDDAAVFGRALSDVEILQVMKGLSKELASGADPADGFEELYRFYIRTKTVGGVSRLSGGDQPIGIAEGS